MDGMVVILQKTLQIYAGTVISRARVRLQANVGAALVGEDQAAADAIVKASTMTRAGEGVAVLSGGGEGGAVTPTPLTTTTCWPRRPCSRDCSAWTPTRGMP